MKINRLLAILFLITLSFQTNAQRKMENLGRGVVAIHSAANEAFISWRLLGTEPEDIGFNLYRSTSGGAAVKLNTSVLNAGTNFKDATANFALTNRYFVKSVLNGVEQAASASFTLPANTPVQSYINVPIHNTPGYAAKFIWVGDLDGDGEFDFVFDKQPTDETQVILLEAYKGDGTFLWQLDCGPNSVNKYNIEPGSSVLDIGHGDNFTVYDINGDGKAEVIVRTANGVKFGDGTTLTDSNDNKQFISVLNGMTGAEICRATYDNPYLVDGPMNGHMGIAYLDGINPSVVWEAKNRRDDDFMNEMTTAWSWQGNSLVQKWQFLTGTQNCPAGHQIRILDVDGDGKDEVCPMGFVIDHDGTKLYSMGDHDIFHGDRFHIGDLDPNRPGLEVYGIQQGYSTTGIMWYYADAKTGEVINTQRSPSNSDMGRGMTGDFDPRYPGYEFFTFVDALYNVSGAKTSTSMPASYPNMRIWWDGDLLSENLDSEKMTKWNYLGNYEDRMFIDGHSTFYGVNQVGPKTPGFYGDILGDWREEVVYEAYDHNSLMVFTTNYPTNTRLYTLAQNPEYRNCFNVKGYYQSNMIDYYLGDGMYAPPVPCIQKANKYWIGSSKIWDKSSTNWLSDSGNAAYVDGDTIMFDIRGNNSDTIRLNTDLSPARIWAMNPAGKDYIISGLGKLTGSMDLIKAQAGKMTFCGAYTYTGKTRISEGTLSINGSLKSNVLIQPKGCLGGIGTLEGGITLEQGLNIEGGRIEPGNGNGATLLGTLTIQGDLAVPGKNNFAFDIVPGSEKINDLIQVNGNLSFSGSNNLILNFKNDLAVSGTYTLIRCTGTLSATKDNFSINGLSGVPFELLIENNQIKIKISTIRTSGNVIWKGSVDNLWNFNNSNFIFKGDQVTFTPNDTILFDESGIQKNVILNDVAITSGITFNATSDYKISGSGAISGSGGLVKSNTNMVTLDMTKNEYIGKTIVNGGVLSISNINLAGEPSSIGMADVDPGNIVINNSTLQIKSNSATNRSVTITGNTVFDIPTSTTSAIFTSEITGTGSLIKNGPGALYFVHSNTYKGQTTIKNGSIYLRSSAGNEQGLGTSGVITMEGGSLFLEDLRANNQITFNMVVPANKTASYSTDGRCALLGTLTGSGTLNISMPYVRTDFKGNWSAFDGIINSSGDFRIANGYGYAKAAVNLVTGGAYYSSSNGAVSFGALSGAVGTTLSNANWTIGAKNTDATFDGVISGFSVTKVGTGSWTLSGANTYTGATTVNAGKLVVKNTTGSATGTGAVSINNGSTLAGSGTVSGTAVIGNTSTISPGENSIATLTFGSSLTLNQSKYEAQIAGGVSASCDKLAVTGTLTCGGSLIVTRSGLSPIGAGQTFQLMSAANITGAFTSVSLPTLTDELQWNTSALYTTGRISIEQATGISKPELKAGLMQNPTKGLFSVYIENIESQVTVTIHNLQGQLFYSKEVSGMGGAFNVDLSDKENGVYLMKIRSKDNSYQVIKLIKE